MASRCRARWRDGLDDRELGSMDNMLIPALAIVVAYLWLVVYAYCRHFSVRINGGRRHITTHYEGER